MAAMRECDMSSQRESVRAQVVRYVPGSPVGMNANAAEIEAKAWLEE
jgi:hypothetical protein